MSPTSNSARHSDQYSVMLPCEPSQFRDFISGLLGKPQTITGEISGAFDIGKEELMNIHHLISQRVEQQNHGTLLQFTSRIVFDDESSVLLNSIDDFVRYQEIKPLVSKSVHLSWTFLIQFQGKPAPEKQVIDLSFTTGGPRFIDDEFSLLTLFKSKCGAGSYRIQHTARTWGTDIQALFENHLNVVITKESPIKSFLRRNSGNIAFLDSIVILALTWWAIWQSATAILAREKTQLEALLAPGVETAKKIDGLLAHVLANPWQPFLLSSLFYILAAIFVSIAIAIFINASTDSYKPSFLRLSPMDEKERRRLLNKYQIQWASFIVSIITGIATGIIGNILYTKYWV